MDLGRVNSELNLSQRETDEKNRLLQVIIIIIILNVDHVEKVMITFYHLCEAFLGAHQCTSINMVKSITNNNSWQQMWAQILPKITKLDQNVPEKLLKNKYERKYYQKLPN